MESVIRTSDLSHSYGRRSGVDGIDLQVGPGTISGFLGPNGMRQDDHDPAPARLPAARRGPATVLGLDCWRDSPRIKRDVGYLPGDLRLHSWMTGQAALRLVGRIRGTDLNRAGGALAERFGLELDVRVRELSRGTRRKLGLVLALAHRPGLLVLDEPSRLSAGPRSEAGAARSRARSRPSS